LAKALVGWLTEAGFLVTVVSSFAAAKSHVHDGLSLLIAEVRLGAYNGLHLSIYAKARGIPTIVVGERDVDLEREADRLGVVYLPREPSRSELLSATLNLLSEHAEKNSESADAPSSMVGFVSWSDLGSLALRRPSQSAQGRRGPLPS
jgi:hypothetical protein